MTGKETQIFSYLGRKLENTPTKANAQAWMISAGAFGLVDHHGRLGRQPAAPFPLNFRCFLRPKESFSHCRVKSCIKCMILSETVRSISRKDASKRFLEWNLFESTRHGSFLSTTDSCQMVENQNTCFGRFCFYDCMGRKKWMQAWLVLIQIQFESGDGTLWKRCMTWAKSWYVCSKLNGSSCL